jgi:uncharacterized protein YdaU (DUF1376 family)
MAKAPVMPVWTDALVGDTTHLSAEQFGAYFLILIATWRNNGTALADDDERMAHISRVTLARWRKKIRPVLAEFFTIDGTGWHQQRLEAEWERVSNLISKRRAFGAKGGRTSAAGKAQGKLGLDAVARAGPKDSSQNPESTFNIESLTAARELGKKNQLTNPVARCARLKTPALKAKIREQLVQKHARYLGNCGRPEQLGAYWAAQLGDDPVEAKRMFEAVDHQMRVAGWDDMAQWRQQHGITA